MANLRNSKEFNEWLKNVKKEYCIMESVILKVNCTANWKIDGKEQNCDREILIWTTRKIKERAS